MPLDFPASPITGATYTGPNNVIWVWDGAKWVNGTQIGTAYAPVQSPVFTGNPTAPNPPSGDADTSVATTAFVSAAVAPAFNGVGRNLIHNPLFNVAQRGNGPFTLDTVYTLDRWRIYLTTAGAASFSRVFASDSNRADIGDETAVYLLSNVFTGSATAGAYHYIAQSIEGIRRLAGKTVTVSFYANAGTALKLGVNALQYFGTGGSPSAAAWALTTGISVSIPGVAFARYSVTFVIPSAIGKTIGTNGDDYTGLSIWYSSAAATNALAGNIGVQSGTINLWGVQLEVGSVATPLEKPDPRYDLANCQRFYQVGQVIYNAYQAAGTGMYMTLGLPTTMRAAPFVVPTNISGGNMTGLAAGAEVGGSAIYVSGVATATGATQISCSFTASADL